MDLAKIRKKLKEAEKKASQEGLERPEGTEEEAPEAVQDRVVHPEEEIAADVAAADGPEEASETEEHPAEDAEGGPEPEPEFVPAEELPVTEPETGPVEAPAAAPFGDEGAEVAGESGRGGAAGGAAGARELEAVTDGDAAADEIVEFLAFKLADENYAFRIEDLEEIVKPQIITAVPRVDSFIVGVTSLRGKIIPVIDLRMRLQISENYGADKSTERIIILKGDKGTIGAVVDRVLDVLRLPGSSITEPPAHLTELESKFIESVAVHDDMFISIIRLKEALNFTMGQES